MICDRGKTARLPARGALFRVFDWNYAQSNAPRSDQGHFLKTVNNFFGDA